MFAMLRNFFAMFSTLFEAGNKLANAANHASSFVEGEAAGFNERTSLARGQELKALRSKYSIDDRRMAAEEAQSVANLNKHLESLAKQAEESTAA